MSGPAIDFDDVAADDALIESLRAGATIDELPADDAAVDVLLHVRDGVAVDDGEARTPVTVPGRAVVEGVVAHRRSIAGSAIVVVVATAGVGTAVAGDPTAAFSYLFRQGVEIGSRLGTPQSDVDVGAMGYADRHDPPVAVSSVPVRQGSAAAQVTVDGETRGPVGYERGSRYWTVPAPRGLESYEGGDGGSAGGHGPDGGLNGFGDTQITERATTPGPGETESVDPDTSTTTPPDEGEIDNDSYGTDPDIDSEESPEPSTDPPTDDGETSLIEPPPTSTEPPPETTTSPPEVTTSPPETSTSPPPETTTSSPPETTATSPTESESESPSSPSPTSSQ